MNTIQYYLTENPCYKINRIIPVEGLMLHSIGVPQPNPKKIADSWNHEAYDIACVHGFIGTEDFYITLPIFEYPGYAHRGWHGGRGENGSVNNTHIGIEMTEPSSIRYTDGANFICLDLDAAQEHVKKVTRNAIQVFAKLCHFHNLDPLADGVIISHVEGHRRGLASNHGDPDHLWPQVGLDYNMDKFRLDVNDELQRIKENEEMDVNKFKELWYEMRQELQDNDASDWSLEARDWAIQTGLVQGTGTGEFNGAWEDLMTREQLVTVLYRFAKMMGQV